MTTKEEVWWGVRRCTDWKTKSQTPTIMESNEQSKFLSCNANYSILIWFFSQLVEESLIDFQGKVAQVMKSVGFTFDDFDFVIHPFQLSGVDRIITVIEDAVSISF